MKLSETISINDKVVATLNDSIVEFDAVVTGVDDSMDLIFITIIENSEEVAVDADQIIANFGQ